MGPENLLVSPPLVKVSSCGKYWECGPDLKPCLFDCPAISEDVGGGTLLFNSVISACDWPLNVDCETGGKSIMSIRFNTSECVANS